MESLRVVLCASVYLILWRSCFDSEVLHSACGLMFCFLMFWTPWYLVYALLSLLFVIFDLVNVASLYWPSFTRVSCVLFSLTQQPHRLVFMLDAPFVCRFRGSFVFVVR